MEAEKGAEEAEEAMGATGNRPKSRSIRRALHSLPCQEASGPGMRISTSNHSCRQAAESGSRFAAIGGAHRRRWQARTRGQS